MTAGRGAGLAALALTVVGVIGIGLAVGSGDEAPAQGATQVTATTQIKRQDLVETDTVDGTLGYADFRRSASRLRGTITWAPKAGSVVQAGRPLFEVDGRKVYLFDGAVPAYRPLRPGLAGDDVRQLERNLRDLGFDRFDAMTVDGTWDAGTTAAVRRWQVSKGIDESGVIEWGRVVFAPGDRRIGAIPGERSPLLTTTSTKRIVAIDLKTTRADLADDGAPVSVEMPDGKDVAGTIVSVGRIARRKPASQQDDDPPATIKVIVRLRGRVGLALDQAPVDVKLEKRRVANVLTVPVTALLARQGGAFAVEVRDGARRRIVAVTPGLYTDGDVAITGAGLRAGMQVSDARL